jgi:hypothetical protein
MVTRCFLTVVILQVVQLVVMVVKRQFEIGKHPNRFHFSMDSISYMFNIEYLVSSVYGFFK